MSDDTPIVPELDVEPTYGETVTWTATLDMDRFPGGKRFQGVWLHPEGSDRAYVLSYRAGETWFPFVEKKVVVTGRPWWPGRDTQHIGADHFEVTTIDLAEGELPWDPVPTQVPEPPTATSAAAVAERGLGHWVRVIATLEALEPDPRWPPAVLRLSDKTALRLEAVRGADAKPLLGQTVTAMARIGRDERGELVLAAPVAICAGDTARCAMEEGY